MINEPVVTYKKLMPDQTWQPIAFTNIQEGDYLRGWHNKEPMSYEAKIIMKVTHVDRSPTQLIHVDWI